MKKIIVLLFVVVSVNVMAQSTYNLDKRRVDISELKNKCDEELLLMRNEIFARRGYVFSKEDLSNYFNEKSWYKPLNDNSKIKLTQLEQDNVATIKKVEDNNSKVRKAIQAYFSKMKTDLKNKNFEVLKGMTLGFNVEEYNGILRNILSHIEVDQIGFDGSKGLYKVQTDTRNRSTYYLSVEGSEIRVGMEENEDSDLKTCVLLNTEFDNGSLLFFIFKLNNDMTISFVQMDGVG